MKKENYKNCSVELEIKNDSGNSLKKSNFDISKVDENSAKKFFDVEEDVLSSVEKQFTVHVKLKDKMGEILSESDYLFLIGDQKEASAQYKEMQNAMGQKNRDYTYGNYLRFFPEMIRTDGKDHQSDTQHPKAKDY